MSRTLIVTGGAGFIGSNFLHMLAEMRPDWRVVNLDVLTYAGNLENLTALEGLENHIFVRGDGDARIARQSLARPPPQGVQIECRPPREALDLPTAAQRLSKDR